MKSEREQTSPGSPIQPLPKANKSLKELEDCKAAIDKVLTYCRETYASDKKKIFTYTQNETKNALQNVTYHIHAMATHFTNVLTLQVAEIEKIDLQLKEVTNRSQLNHQEVGIKALMRLRIEHEIPLLSADKTQKLEGAAVPSLPSHPRQKIDFSELDGVGISLVSGSSASKFGTIRNPPPNPSASVRSMPVPTSQASFSVAPPTLARSFEDLPPPPPGAPPGLPSDLPPPPPGLPPDFPEDLPPPPPGLPPDVPTDLLPPPPFYPPDELPPPPPN